MRVRRGRRSGGVRLTGQKSGARAVRGQELGFAMDKEIGAICCAKSEVLPTTR